MIKRALIEIILVYYMYSDKAYIDFFQMDEEVENIERFENNNIVDSISNIYIGSDDENVSGEDEDIRISTNVKLNCKIDITLFSNGKNKPSKFDEYARIVSGDLHAAGVLQENEWLFELTDLSIDQYEVICKRVVAFKETRK